jgi:predicted transcriptional regulator
MALIGRKETLVYKTVTLRLPEHTVARLDRYCEYVNRRRNDVVDALLRYAFAHDHEFAVREGLAGHRDTREGRTPE